MTTNKKYPSSNRCKYEKKQEERLETVKTPLKLEKSLSSTKQVGQQTWKRLHNNRYVSGALEHVVADVGLFQSIIEVGEVKLELADGTTVTS